MKKKISAPNVFGEFTWQSRYYNFDNNFYFNAHLFNTRNLFFLLVIYSFIHGWFNHTLWALTISVSFYLFYSFMRARLLAQNLQVKRIAESKGREKEDFEIHYEISNGSGFFLPAFSFRQKFDGVQDGSFEVVAPEGIDPQTRKRLSVKVPLNAGMGIREMGDFCMHVHDELSLFPYRVDFSGTQEIEVHPLIVETPQLIKSISPDSTEFGFYDVQKKGDSNLFIGTREYRHGDPIKNVNWKLSRKSMKLIVNEFEKNTNTYITLLLDLELNSQVGLGAISTWEAAKDLALSIAANEIKFRNYVQVLSQDIHIPFGTGEAQMVSMERHFTYHEMAKSGIDHLVHLQGLPSQSQIYFFCPLIHTRNITETLDVLKKLRLMGHRVTVFGLDPYQGMKKAASKDAFAPLLIAGEEARKQFSVVSDDLKRAGIPFVRLDVSEKISLRDMIRVRAKHLIDMRPQ
ncbi:MAG: DUF58 domain-containing protein [Bdellovibrionota bacterium]